MKQKEFGPYLVIRLEKGEEIITSLKDAIQHTGIEGGFFYGLGVGTELELGYFDAHKKAYIKKKFDGEYEFANMAGNVTVVDGEIVIHCHVTITDAEFRAFGGHLFKGTVPATLEVIVFPFARQLTRSHDQTTGLNLLEL